jgi:hypothetical protein
VRENYVTKTGVALLKTIAKDVDASDQEEDEPANRYISAYE